MNAIAYMLNSILKGGLIVAGKTIKKSKESEKRIVIQSLRDMGVFEGQKGEKLHSMDYFPLVYLLAIHKAMLS